MESFQVYKDMKMRTGGEIYIGVVGPVRTGKSTFIKRFMDLLVLPKLTDSHVRERTQDELPQSASGTTIMTTEPKFVPKEAALIRLSDDAEVKIRLADCVGFMVEGASGHMENGGERQVKTPWYEYEIPFTKAAEIGTRKVIRDHATIGVVVTTDGSVAGLPRENYIEPEEKTVRELKEIGKPFVILLNCIKPYTDEAQLLSGELQRKYGACVVPVNCEQMKPEEIHEIMRQVLYGFPVTEVENEEAADLPVEEGIISNTEESSEGAEAETSESTEATEPQTYPDEEYVPMYEEGDSGIPANLPGQPESESAPQESLTEAETATFEEVS